MNDLRDRLKNADPVATEAPLPEQDAHQMRRAIVAAAEAQASSPAGWRTTSWAAATVLVAVTIAIGMSGWFEREEQQAVRPAVGPAPDAPGEPPRQVQFVAPGGTRVIWVFNANFKP